MSAAHKDTPRVGWQQQSGQFLQSLSRGSGSHYPENFLANVSAACSGASCELNHSNCTSSGLLSHIINKPHGTDSKAAMHTPHTTWHEKREALDGIINKKTPCKRFKDYRSCSAQWRYYSQQSLPSRVLHLTASTLNNSLSLLAAGG